MENKQLFMSALSVGLGVGVGMTVSRWTSGGDDSSGMRLTPQTMEREMLSMIVDGKDSKATFDQFPYYLSEQTRVLLTSAAFVYLKNIDFSKHTRNLSPASRTILLSGPAELYQQMLAKALAHYFEAKLLLLDVTDFSLKVQSKYGGSYKENAFQRSTSETTLARMSDLLGSTLSMFQTKQEATGTLRRQSSVSDFGSRGSETFSNPPNLRRNASSSTNIEELATKCPTNPSPLRRTSSLAFDEKLFIQTLYKVITFVSKSSPMVLYLRDVEKLLCRSQRVYTLFQKMLKKISGPVLIIGSQVVDLEKDYRELDERITSVFPYNIEIKPPQEENHLVSWKSQLEEDMKMIQFQDNRNHISEVLAANDLDCDDLASICVADTIDLSKYIEEIVVSAISYHLTHTKNPEYRNGKLVISTASLSHGLSLFQEGKSVKDTSKDVGGPKPETKVESARPSEAEASAPKNTDNVAPATPKAPGVPADNEFEKRIRPEVIPASEIGVTFSDVGSLDDIKESLQELVMLPLRRPDLFIGGLLKPCRGILLFGPPGTGKTMLAKAIANEAGASFINVSMSTITSKWFGEDEKNVRALFSLAAKVSPTIIFVDEVDSMLGQRSRAGEHEAMRKIKNEFMTHWDGLLTKPGERILVLAATNRPFDLDEAIIRRFERRIMVGLPSVENREKILTTLLAKEQIDEGLNLKEVANMTEGYTGSDLKNLCNTAAYRPVRELIQQERLKDMEKKRLAESGVGPESPEENEEEKVIKIRPLNMEDFREAKNQVAASFASEGSIMSELKQWNEQYGEGGSRKKEQLSYFL
ncbi:putative AAA+ ATPase domain, ATPase, AAA-type, core, AAA ATPase, AAA+ lid domain-containing protein [Helianthus annuus]|uniref:Adenosinetriphosphatase n=1 Tax=Helianthus annuus TaxID=4232 RepID=A0A251UFV0_HELAN|nr:spastin [Helianthus annuus]KAF5800840.1 putative adenosinetriphosphatase [Helianthus annuus]KAJ0572155.1 putative AAA+ ATPase domain, ATPase, AAA-type, core, AAA ATPase, AAA+ lid domain-containing protein [Helianthus annuus]KAJ0910256.1 putative AAA+ ATPase domain, ATPase, AAA-type, core, AAA ATPase, AAA+ lid domain-containing protein [Helianthus annuus]